MPKEKQAVRTQSRRAASKEALKQMHLLLGDEKKYEISSDDDDVIEVEVQPPKKKYKLSHRKSSDGNDRDVIVLKTVNENLFDLEVVVEELAPCQRTRQDQLKKETSEVEAKIEQLLATPNTEVVYKGIFATAVEINEQIQSIISSATAPPTTHQYTLPAATNSLSTSQTPVQQAVPSQSIVLQQPPPGSTAIPQSYQLVMDPRLGVIVGTMATTNTTSNTSPLQLYQPKVTMTTTATPVTNSDAGVGTMKTRRGTLLRQVPSTALPPLHKTTVVQNKTAVVTANKPANKITNKLTVKQNLVKTNIGTAKPAQKAVAAQKAILPIKARAAISAPPPMTPFRPTETNVEGGLSMGKPTKSIDLTTEDGRALPDSREVSFNKLQGRTYPSLVVVARPHLRVKDLAADRAKLDVKVKSVLMFPPTKFTEWLIQQGLVRSDQKCSVHGSNALKLGMYSDASKFPYSGGYVWISECCPQRFVSVFSGSLFEGAQHPPMAILKLLYHWCCQTIVQNVTQWVKVDNLFVKGMYTWLRAICTVALHTHIKQLGGPGVKVQVGVISLGTTSQDGNKREVKVEVLGILETTTRHIRLRAVEPLADGERNYKKRFTKILEPVFNWVHPSSIIVTDLTVDKATLHQMGFLHVSQSTSTDYANSNRTIMEYLRRIVPRMFQNTLSLLSRQIIQQFLDELVWREWYGTTVLQCFDNMVQHLSEQTRYDAGMSLVVRLNKVIANPFKNWAIPLGTNANITVPSTPKTIDAPPKRYSRQRKPATPQPPPTVQEVIRPAKSTSPDVPEQLVPLENYYYGTITPSSDNRAKITINIKCPFCKLTFNSNILLMNHLFKHAHNVSNEVQLCKYCLTIVPSGNDLLKHISTAHPDETKFDNGFVCLICEVHFRNPFILGKHMSKEHSPSELPYLCGTCGFRCSNHKLAVDHFYQTHDHGTTIQCPFCLKSTTIYSGGRNITQNMNYFIQHLQKHQKKHLAKRCNKCVLWFIQKEFLKDHQVKMHASQRGKHGLVPSFAPRNGVMVPKSKMDKCPDDGKVINFSTFYFNVGKTLNCKECDKSLATPKHFASFESCQNSNCQYSTCCSNAMQEHVTKCKSLHAELPAERLPFEMYCICGYKDIYGNSMAKHLTICEKKSAYPSKQAAKSATVTQCMLDVLGLVRKPEEAKDKEVMEVVKEVVEKRSENTPLILKHRGRPRRTLMMRPLGRKVDDGPQINISDVRGGVDLAESDSKDGKEETEETNTEIETVQDEKEASNEEEKEESAAVENEDVTMSEDKDKEVERGEEETKEKDQTEKEDIQTGKEQEDKDQDQEEGINEKDDVEAEKESDEKDQVKDEFQAEKKEEDKDQEEDISEKDDLEAEKESDEKDQDENRSEKDVVEAEKQDEDKDQDEAPSEKNDLETEKDSDENRSEKNDLEVEKDSDEYRSEKDDLEADKESEDKDQDEAPSEKNDLEAEKDSDEYRSEKDQDEVGQEKGEVQADNKDQEEEEEEDEDVSQKDELEAEKDQEDDRSEKDQDQTTSEEPEREEVEQLSEDTQVSSEGKEVTEDEESQSQEMSTSENTEEDAKNNDECLMEVDSCSNKTVAIESTGESENIINDICPMDTD